MGSSRAPAVFFGTLRSSNSTCEGNTKRHGKSAWAKRGCLLLSVCIAEGSDPVPASATATQCQKHRTGLASREFSWCFLPSLPASDSRSVPPCHAPFPLSLVGPSCRQQDSPGPVGAAAAPLNLAHWVWGVLFFSPCLF